MTSTADLSGDHVHDTALIHAVANDPALRDRLGSVIARRIAGTTRTEAALLAQPPIDNLAELVAVNPSILGTVRTALDGQPEGESNVARAVDAVPDSDLEYVVVSELTCLA